MLFAAANTLVRLVKSIEEKLTVNPAIALAPKAALKKLRCKIS